MHQEQYEKIKQFLLDNNQQELVGHLDGLWQENQKYAAAQPANPEATPEADNPGEPEPAETPDEPKQPSSSDADAKPDPNTPPRTSAQDFQDDKSAVDSQNAQEA